MCEQQRLRPACAYVQSDQSLCYSLEYSMNVKLLAEHHLEVLEAESIEHNRTEHNFIENYASQATQRWRKRETQTCYAVKYT